MPGQHLFEYRDDQGVVRAVSSSEVNAYLREISGRDITAKDFRTWAGTVKAAIGFAGSDALPYQCKSTISHEKVRGIRGDQQDH